LSAGVTHSVAIPKHDTLYTWGKGTCVDWDAREEKKPEVPLGLGHGDRATKLVPTRVAPALLQGVRVGRCHGLPP